jgi:hypothetical protein
VRSGRSASGTELRPCPSVLGWVHFGHSGGVPTHPCLPETNVRYDSNFGSVRLVLHRAQRPGNCTAARERHWAKPGRTSLSARPWLRRQSRSPHPARQPLRIHPIVQTFELFFFFSLVIPAATAAIVGAAVVEPISHRVSPCSKSSIRLLTSIASSAEEPRRPAGSRIPVHVAYRGSAGAGRGRRARHHHGGGLATCVSR